MSDMTFTVIFEGVDPDEEPYLDDLSDARYYFSYSNNLTYITVILDDTDCPNALDAAMDAINLVESQVPGSLALKTDPDLVSVADIAERADLSRETVRLYAAGRRFKAFPNPLGVVGDNIRVWPWSEVNEWLAQHNHGQPERPMSTSERAKLDAMLVGRSVPTATPQPMSAPRPSLTYATETRVKIRRDSALPGASEWRLIGEGLRTQIARRSSD